MPRINFQQQLVALKDKLLAMAALAQQAVESAVEAYIKRDEALCQHVRDYETAINTAHRALDEMAAELLAKEQPMAIDLRFIVSVIKINSDLERIGDQSMSIAIRTREMLEYEGVPLPADFVQMGASAGRMIRVAIQALLDSDARVAESVVAMDDEVDALNREAQTRLLELIQQKPDLTPQALNGILIARSLERIADHATNIATDVIFWVRGADVRHQLSMALD